MKGAGQCVFVENLINYDHIRTWFGYGDGVMPGRRAGSVVSYYIAEGPKQGKKGSSQLQRRSMHFDHLVILFICGPIPIRPDPQLYSRQGTRR